METKSPLITSLLDDIKRVSAENACIANEAYAEIAKINITPYPYFKANQIYMFSSYVSVFMDNIARYLNGHTDKEAENFIRFHAFNLTKHSNDTSDDVTIAAMSTIAEVLNKIIAKYFDK